jgi:hypothetical protein
MLVRFVPAFLLVLSQRTNALVLDLPMTPTDIADDFLDLKTASRTFTKPKLTG